MKWPSKLSFIRHGESEYNILKKKRSGIPLYESFLALFNKEFDLARDDSWASEELKDLARRCWKEFGLDVSDYDTPLTEAGLTQAVETGKKLRELIELPDIIYISPYLRTRQTLEGLTLGWPELGGVKKVSEERIREQEHGLSTIYNDWKIFYTLNPSQGLLFKREGDYAYRFLNGENKADVRDRVRSFLGTLIRENSEQNVLVISHHLTLLSLRSTLERWDREKFLEVGELDKPINCGVTIYKGDRALGKNGKLVLDTYNKKLYL